MFSYNRNAPLKYDKAIFLCHAGAAGPNLLYLLKMLYIIK